MATTFSLVPLVGFDRIVSIVNDEPVAIPLAADQSEGRSGKMRIALRLLQSDTQNANDVHVVVRVQNPLKINLDALGEDPDLASYGPFGIISQSGQLNPADTHPRIDVEEAADSAEFIYVNLYFDASAAPGSAKYDVVIDWSHTIAS